MLAKTDETVLTERACDALALAYSPNQPLEKGYYIPSDSRVEEAFGYALRALLGEKPDGWHWADSVRWPTIDNLDRLDQRIYQGVWKAVSGDRDCQTRFQMYFHFLRFNLEHDWVYLKGDLYRFKAGARKKATEEFQRFWTEAEKTIWRKIHRFMRQYTKREFERKSCS